MPDRDYYDVLGVARDATPDQIKKAYRAKARKDHPDVNPEDKSAEARFKETQKAYDVLSDAEKRKLYDQVGRSAFESYGSSGPTGPARGWGTHDAGTRSEYFDINDLFSQGRVDPGMAGGGLFEEIMGKVRGARGGRQSPPGRATAGDASAQLTIPFLTAVRGGDTSVQIEREGRRESLVVKIPPGLESGAKLRLKGQGGGTGPAGTRGSLTVEVQVEPHPYFQRDGWNILVEVPTTLGEAVLGGKIEVPTINGLKTLAIPAGTSSGQKLRLKGQGVPASANHAAGDQFVVVRIVIPKHIDETSKKLIEQFNALNPLSPRERLW